MINQLVFKKTQERLAGLATDETGLIFTDEKNHINVVISQTLHRYNQRSVLESLHGINLTLHEATQLRDFLNSVITSGEKS